MFRLRRDTKYVIILFVILISVYLGIKRSNLNDVFFRKQIRIDTSNAENIFKNSTIIMKTQMKFNVNHLETIRTVLSEIFTREDIYIKLSETKEIYQTIIFEYPNSLRETVLSKLRNVEGFDSENIRSLPSSPFNANIKENLKNNQLAKIRIQELINKTTSPNGVAEFRIQLDKVQATIDSLMNQDIIQKHNEKYDIIMITSTKQTDSSTNLKQSVKTFILSTSVVLLILIIGLIFVYYITILLTKLMAAMGIKTARSSTGSYNYNYKRKGYGRKIKRIYKDEDGKTVKKE
ncbi:MAG: hypothetical protein H8E11_09570 [Candidatus Cloacimonetes bacterium]|nr:hypothetical protein [Candidatus Cloacimonadota bacterium]